MLDNSGGDGSASDSSGWRAYSVSGSDSFAGCNTLDSGGHGNRYIGTRCSPDVVDGGLRRGNSGDGS